MDAEEASFFYEMTASKRVALDFSAALEDAYRFITENPTAGSRRYADLLSLPGVRTWTMKRFPYIVFYAANSETIEVLRVLHAHRDIGSLFGDPAAEDSSES